MLCLSRKTKKHGVKGKVVVFFTCILFIFALFAVYIKTLVTPLIVETSKAQIKVCATKAMNYAITEAMSQEANYNNLINITTGEDGKINLIEANSSKVNTVSMMIERITLVHLLEISKTKIKIPLGAFTGISLLSGMGPPVEIEIYPYGEVSCKFLSQFVSAGVNQTQHKIYVNVDTKVNVVLPFRTVTIEMTNEVLICEGIIIGEIPETYLKSNTLTEMLNLIPS